jgi:hypothetical protein
MKNKTYNYISLACLAGLALLLSACGEKNTEDNGASTDVSALDSIQLLDTKPVDALAVKTAREQLKPGEEAVVFGQIGGAEQPFFDGYAGFVLGDTDITFCDEMGDEHCDKPWDACCEDSDKLKVSRASVQFVDAEGQPIMKNIKGLSGIKELDEVVVIGEVAKTSTPGNLIINARGIYVE